MNVNKYIMRKFFTLLSFCVVSTSFGQVYDGFADNKTSLGASFQSGGIGIHAAFDRGINDFLSYGVTFGIIVQNDVEFPSIPDGFGGFYTVEPEAGDKFMETIDFNVRLNVHLNQLLNLGDNLDFFAGPNLGRNFGGQVGTRYMISDGFGFFAEANVPFKKNLINISGEEESANYYDFYEQPVFSIGIVISN